MAHVVLFHHQFAVRVGDHGAETVQHEGQFPSLFAVNQRLHVKLDFRKVQLPDDVASGRHFQGRVHRDFSRFRGDVGLGHALEPRGIVSERFQQAGKIHALRSTGGSGDDDSPRVGDDQVVKIGHGLMHGGKERRHFAGFFPAQRSRDLEGGCGMIQVRAERGIQRPNQVPMMISDNANLLVPDKHRSKEHDDQAQAEDLRAHLRSHNGCQRSTLHPLFPVSVRDIKRPKETLSTTHEGARSP